MGARRNQIATLLLVMANLLAPRPGAPGAGVVESALRAQGARSPISARPGQGLWLVTGAGRVLAYGDARDYGDAHAESAVVGAAATPDGRGYWLASAGGGVYSFGDATAYGSLGGRHLASAVVGMAATADGKGYWLASADGTVHGFGDATATGPSTGPSTGLSTGPGTGPGAPGGTGPVVGIVADPGTGGFWLASADGAVRGYGGAPTYPRAHLPAPVAAVAATPDGRGYWVVARDGRAAARGDAGRHGALNGAYDRPVVGIAAAPGGAGYWLAAADGHVFSYGSAGLVAPPPGSAGVVAIVAAPPTEAPAPPAPPVSPGPARPGGTGVLGVTTTGLAAATVSVPYTAQLGAQGGAPPYTWALTAGGLPPGLSLSAPGLISGTPAATGSYSFTAAVTDGASSPAQATAQFSIAVVAPGLSQLPVSRLPSGNWSGYVAGPGPYTAVSGTFTVPPLSPAAPPADLMSEWVGIGGSGSGAGSLIQAGVTEVPDPATSIGFDVFAWWEVLPASSQPITSMTVNPGDEVSVGITRLAATSWEIDLNDATDGQRYSQDVTYDGPGASAEWVVEAPTDGGTNDQLALAPYTGAIDFTGLSASGSSTALSEVVMTQDGQQVSTPSALTPAGFSVAYGATVPAAPP